MSRAAEPIDLMKLLDEAEFFEGLTEWESDFLDDLRGRLVLNKGEYPISDKQAAVLRRIEGKMRK